MGGDEVDILTFFGQEPRPLATDGDTVWVGVFMSGNQTTIIALKMLIPVLSTRSCTTFHLIATSIMRRKMRSQMKNRSH